MQTSFRPKVVFDSNYVSVKGPDWTLQIRKTMTRAEGKTVFLLKLVRVKCLPQINSFVYEDLHDRVWLSPAEFSQFIYGLANIAKNGEDLVHG
jgi:hypothetical protein